MDLLAGSVPIEEADTAFDPLQALLQGKAIKEVLGDLSGRTRTYNLSRHYMIVRKSPTKADWWYKINSTEWSCDHDADLTDHQITIWWNFSRQYETLWQECESPA